MLPPNLNLALATPEIFLLIMTCVVMVVDLFSPPEKREGRLFILSLGTLALVALNVYSIATPMVAPRLAFNGMFIVDGMAMLLKLAITVAVAVVIVYSRAYLVARKLFTGEFILLVLFATLGMMVMVSANHFISLSSKTRTTGRPSSCVTSSTASS